MQIGLGYAFGIVLALVICSATSGGHFSPSVSITQVLYRGFPPLKAARYIMAQIFGGYIACLLVYVQYKDMIDVSTYAERFCRYLTPYKATNAALEAKGLLEAIQFTPNGTAGVFAFFVTPGSNLARVLLNEFVSVSVRSFVDYP
jgi:glycerol uptake facilitator-like aquaporin